MKIKYKTTNQQQSKQKTFLAFFVTEDTSGYRSIVSIDAIKSLQRHSDRVAELVLQNERLRHQLQIYKTINALLCRKVRAQKNRFSF